jgi:hypothetical protein
MEVVSVAHGVNGRNWFDVRRKGFLDHAWEQWAGFLHAPPDW